MSALGFKTRVDPRLHSLLPASHGFVILISGATPADLLADVSSIKPHVPLGEGPTCICSIGSRGI